MNAGDFVIFSMGIARPVDKHPAGVIRKTTAVSSLAAGIYI
jgi:hypothetical protein